MRLWIGLFGAVLAGSAVQAQELTLDQYREAVHKSDPSWRSVKASEQATILLEKEADAVTGLQLMAQASYMNDNRPTVNPAFQGDRTENTSYLLGIKQQTAYGLRWDLSENLGHTKIYDSSLAAIPVPDYYDTYPQADLNISLWRNFLGAETSAQIFQLQQQSVARKKQVELQRIQNEIDLDSAFYTVLSMQQTIDAQKDGLGRAERVLEWTRSRIARNLVDGSDIYQAQAAVTARKIELLSLQASLTKAVEKFNSLRGIESSELTEKLVVADIDLQKLSLLKRDKKVRRDVALKKYDIASSEASYQALREKYKPQLELSLSGQQDGRDVNQNTSAVNSSTNGKNYFMASLVLTVPLDQGRDSDLREGYAALVKSQTLSEQSRAQDENLSWENNVTMASQLREQITAIRELEDQQKNKADAEREKFNKGRSTLFQVLTYEQDYLAAQSQKINLELQARQFLIQQNLFE